jgi:hypothetical protein
VPSAQREKQQSKRQPLPAHLPPRDPPRAREHHRCLCLWLYWYSGVLALHVLKYLREVVRRSIAAVEPRARLV